MAPNREIDNESYTHSKRFVVAVRDQHDLLPLLRVACALAQTEQARVYVLTVSASGKSPAWLKIPAEFSTVPVEVLARAGRDAAASILHEVRRLAPDRLFMGWAGQWSRGRYLMGKTLDPVVQGAPCDVIIVRAAEDAPVRRILVPAAGGPNAPEAFIIAHALAPEAEITALYVAPARTGAPGVLAGRDRLETLVKSLPDGLPVETRVVQAEGPVAGILREAGNGYDLLLLGAGNENAIGRFLFGDIAQAVMLNAPIPVLVVRRRLNYLRTFTRQLWTLIFGLVPTLTIQEQAEVYKVIRRGSRAGTDFLVMITLAATIASFGLLLNSPAVIIGAMLVAPLMTAILGMGLSLVLGDARFFWTALSSTIRGMALAMLMGFVVAWVAPGIQITQEMLSRGNPSVLDLGVALVSGAAAAYAISRRDVSAALAGVAIAAALAPPLATVGIALQAQEWLIAGGALLLFLTNMVSIVAAGGLMFFLLGFRPDPGQPGRAQILQRGARSIVLLLLLVTVPLGLLTRQSLRTLHLERAVESALRVEIQQLPGGELVSWRQVVGEDSAVLYLDVTLRMEGVLSYGAARELQEQVAAHLNRPVALSVGAVPTTRLHAFVPPTATPTPEPTATGLPSPTATATATPTPTASPTPTFTPTPTATPTVTPTPTSTPVLATVGAVGRLGLRVYYSPGGLEVARLPEGEVLVLLAGPVAYNGALWYRVQTLDGALTGWVAGEFLLTP